MKTRMTELLGIKYPIMQGGMQHLGVPELAAAVSEAGGLGTINVTIYPDPEDLRKAIKEVKAKTDKPFAVNISLIPSLHPGQELFDQVKVILEEGVTAVETAGASPQELADVLNAHKDQVKWIHKAACVKHAKKAESMGADLITMAGFEVAGHPHTDGVGTMVLANRTAREVKVPVLAAGGIADGRGLLAALSLGCEGVVKVNVMKVIDIHAHIYEKVAGITQGQPMSSTSQGKVTIGNREIQFLPPSFERSCSTAEALIAYMDWCGIEKALLMPNPFYGYHNYYFKESVKKYPDRLRGVALVDIMKGKAAAEELAQIYDEGILFGMKIEVDSTFQCAPGTRLADPKLAPVWDCCEQYHQPMFIHMFRREDIVDLELLAKTYPHITFVICHMGADICFRAGMPKRNYEKVLQIVKEYENVYIDTSTVPDYYEEEYPWKTSVNIIEECYRKVGADKMMWASDYPGMLKKGTLNQLIRLVTEECKNIPESAKEKIMAENARRLFF